MGFVLFPFVKKYLHYNNLSNAGRDGEDSSSGQIDF